MLGQGCDMVMPFTLRLAFEIWLPLSVQTLYPLKKTTSCRKLTCDYILEFIVIYRSTKILYNTAVIQYDEFVTIYFLQVKGNILMTNMISFLPVTIIYLLVVPFVLVFWASLFIIVVYHALQILKGYRKKK